MAEEVTPDHVQAVATILANITPDEQKDMHALESELSILYAHRDLIRNLRKLIASNEPKKVPAAVDQLQNSILTSFGRVLEGQTQDPALELRFAELEKQLMALSQIKFYNEKELRDMTELGLDSPLARNLRTQATKTPWGDIAIRLRRLRAEWGHLQQEKQHVVLHEFELLNDIKNGMQTSTLSQREIWQSKLQESALSLELLLRNQKETLEGFNSFLKEQRTMEGTIKQLTGQKTITLDMIKHVTATFKSPAEFQTFMGKLLRYESKFDNPELIRKFLSKASYEAGVRGQVQERAARYRAETDVLTQIPNRGVFEQRIANEISLGLRYSLNFSVLMIDADHFKGINDVYGHAAGDRALVMVAKTCQQSVRDTDLVARWGGEEFVALLPKTDKQGAIILALRIREAIAAAGEHLMTTLNQELKTTKGITGPRTNITVSIGLATFMEDGQTADALMARADKALYHAKDSNRDVVSYFRGNDLALTREKPKASFFAILGKVFRPITRRLVKRK